MVGPLEIVAYLRTRPEPGHEATDWIARLTENGGRVLGVEWRGPVVYIRFRHTNPPVLKQVLRGYGSKNFSLSQRPTPDLGH